MKHNKSNHIYSQFLSQDYFFIWYVFDKPFFSGSFWERVIVVFQNYFGVFDWNEMAVAFEKFYVVMIFLSFERHDIVKNG